MIFLRFVLYSEELGVFIGTGLGLGFWSKFDAAGQDHACVFESENQIRSFVATLAGARPAHWRAVPVLSNDGWYASIAQCKAAGLPGWTP